MEIVDKTSVLLNLLKLQELKKQRLHRGRAAPCKTWTRNTSEQIDRI